MTELESEEIMKAKTIIEIVIFFFSYMLLKFSVFFLTNNF